MKVAIVANGKKEGTRTILPRFLDALRREKIDPVLHSDLKGIFPDSFIYKSPPELFNEAEMIVSFGGDGTILFTANISNGTGVPILGVNLGKVGFLAEISPEEISHVSRKLLKGDYEIIERVAFTACINNSKWFALNDVVLDRNTDTRILGLTVWVDNEYAGDFHADGVIISTPTGSTAHSMAAGGPIVMPDCSVIILSPICPHSLTMRPMIIDASREVRIGISEGYARMAVDGQSFVEVPPLSEVSVRKADEPVRIARFRDKTYFDILHTRLKWGVSLKLKNA
jgi:NAD+ kinase